MKQTDDIAKGLTRLERDDFVEEGQGVSHALAGKLMRDSVVVTAASLIASGASFLRETLAARLLSPSHFGVVGIFQPWWFALYRLGVPMLLVSTLAYILWSHITPEREHRPSDTERLGQRA